VLSGAKAAFSQRFQDQFFPLLELIYEKRIVSRNVLFGDLTLDIFFFILEEAIF
jgi:hypothetical protein